MPYFLHLIHFIIVSSNKYQLPSFDSSSSSIIDQKSNNYLKKYNFNYIFENILLT